MSNRISYCAQWIVANYNFYIDSPDLYAGLGPENPCLPIVVYDIISDTPSADFCKDMSRYLVQFKVYDTEENLQSVYQIMDNIRDHFDNAKYSDPDYTIEACAYNNSYLVRDQENKGWMGIVEYLIWMH